MAYTKKHILQKSLEAIKKYNLVFINEIFAYVEFGQSMFYEKKMQEVEAIKEALEKNKIVLKKGLQKKWYDQKNAITQLALYKLIGTEDERKAISSAQVEVKGDVKIKTFKVGYDDDDEVKKPSSDKKEGSEQ